MKSLDELEALARTRGRWGDELAKGTLALIDSHETLVEHHRAHHDSPKGSLEQHVADETRRVEQMEDLLLELWDHPLMDSMQSMLARKDPPLIARIGAVRASRDARLAAEEETTHD